MGKCCKGLGSKALALKYFNQMVHEDPLLDKGWLPLLTLCTSGSYQSIVILIKH
jgi:hypothetical protein